MNAKNIEIFADVELLYEAAASRIIALAKNAAALRKRFVISLSGGKTPEQLFKLLVDSPFSERMPWKNTFIFWGDERCVPLDNERNNAHQAKVVLLNKVPIPFNNIHRIPVNLPPVQAAQVYQQMLQVFFGDKDYCFDLILLGLGENGHTASLFPNTPVLNATEAEIQEVYIVEEKMFRITMTAPLINQAKHILFLVTGEKKATVLKTIIKGAYDPHQYPAQLIKPIDGDLHWFVDTAAAKELQ
jgi:6-phosphogluconolactonase